jgi:hypothetical protein
MRKNPSKLNDNVLQHCNAVQGKDSQERQPKLAPVETLNRAPPPNGEQERQNCQPVEPFIEAIEELLIEPTTDEMSQATSSDAE